jgi:hypothetical protein
MQYSFTPAEMDLLTGIVEQACANLAGATVLLRNGSRPGSLHVPERERSFDARLAVTLNGKGIRHSDSCKTI